MKKVFQSTIVGSGTFDFEVFWNEKDYRGGTRYIDVRRIGERGKGISATWVEGKGLIKNAGFAQTQDAVKALGWE